MLHINIIRKRGISDEWTLESILVEVIYHFFCFVDFASKCVSGKYFYDFVFLLQNRDDKLTFDEFLEGSKKDPTIIQALTLYDMAQPQGQGWPPGRHRQTFVMQDNECKPIEIIVLIPTSLFQNQSNVTLKARVCVVGVTGVNMNAILL